MATATVSLSTERLLLRPMREADIAPTAEALGDPAVSRMLARVPHPYDERDARDFLALVERGRATGELEHFVVVSRADPDGRPIGAIGVHAAAAAGSGGHARAAGVAEVGYWIARPHWNRGYAREALAMVARHALYGRNPPPAAIVSTAALVDPVSPVSLVSPVAPVAPVALVALVALVAHAFESNAASARVLEACGFTCVERGIPVRCLATGRDEPSARFELRRG